MQTLFICQLQAPNVMFIEEWEGRSPEATRALPERGSAARGPPTPIAQRVEQEGGSLAAKRSRGCDFETVGF